MSTRHQSHTFTWLQQADFTRRSSRRSAWRNGCFVLCCRRPTQCVEASAASGGCARTWHSRQLQRTLTALHLATPGDKPRRKSGEEAHRLPLPYACIWRLLTYLSSFMSAHVCSQLTTKARRNRRRSFNFRSCIFWSSIFSAPTLDGA